MDERGGNSAVIQWWCQSPLLVPAVPLILIVGVVAVTVIIIIIVVVITVAVTVAFSPSPVHSHLFLKPANVFCRLLPPS